MNFLSYTLARDFLFLRRKVGFAAKHAAQATATFHGVSEIRVLCAYELYEQEVQYGRS